MENNQQMNEKTKIIIDCNKCEYFYITWDKHFPNGCKVFGFKGSKRPSLTVYEASGSPCSNFKEKLKPK